MKIGSFSQKYHLSPETVRFYVNQGILTPQCHNGRYDFGFEDDRDMEFLLFLKSLHFSLADIHRIISLKRLSNFESTDDLNDYMDLLFAQLDNLLENRSDIAKAIDTITSYILSLSPKSLPKEQISGVPLNALKILACPHCQKDIKLNNCTISDNQIMSGTLTCSCGYRAEIKDGIILGDSGPIVSTDIPDIGRNRYRMMSPELITFLQKTYFELLNYIETININGKIVLEDCVNNYFFCYSNLPKLNPNALYIFSDKFEPLLRNYKELIEKQGIHNNILYIAAGPHHLPIRHQCVDVYIDYDSSNEYAIFYNSFAYPQVKEYLSSHAAYLGIFCHFERYTNSLKNLRKKHPYAWQFSFDYNRFSKCLDDEWDQINIQKEFGYVLNSGHDYSFSYHETGEKLWLSPFLCMNKK